jgi:mono/diheme cytochrome c family protein
MTPAARKWLRRGALTLVGLAVLAGAGLWLGTQLAERKMQRKIDVKVQPVALLELGNTAAIERGRYLYASRGCADCHGANGGGRTFVDDPNGVRVAGPHISPGPGSVTAAYRPEDWVRAIRHGVHPLGRPLMIMPSEDYNRFTDGDLAALVAYIRAMPPAQGGAAVIELPLPVRALYGYGLILDAAAKIDHSLPPAAPVPEGVSVAHGAYVANMCIGCHGAKLAGGKIPGGPPDWPPAARLAPGEGSVMARYPDAESLLHLFKTGQRADGTAVKVMPFESLRAISETDARALHLYLKSLAG